MHFDIEDRELHTLVAALWGHRGHADAKQVAMSDVSGGRGCMTHVMRPAPRCLVNGSMAEVRRRHREGYRLHAP